MTAVVSRRIGCGSVSTALMRSRKNTGGGNLEASGHSSFTRLKALIRTLFGYFKYNLQWISIASFDRGALNNPASLSKASSKDLRLGLLSVQGSLLGGVEELSGSVAIGFSFHGFDGFDGFRQGADCGVQVEDRCFQRRGFGIVSFRIRILLRIRWGVLCPGGGGHTTLPFGLHCPPDPLPDLAHGEWVNPDTVLHRADLFDEMAADEVL